MKAIEGKLGRVFLLRLEEGEKTREVLAEFAKEKGIVTAQVFAVADHTLTGIIAPGESGAVDVRLPAPEDPAWNDGEIVVQELLGVNFRRVRDPASGKETLAKVASTKTRVMEKAAPAPIEEGPGTIPVFIYNAEFN